MSRSMIFVTDTKSTPCHHVESAALRDEASPGEGRNKEYHERSMRSEMTMILTDRVVASSPFL